MLEPGIFVKGPVLRRLDEVVNDGPTRRMAFLEALKYANYRNLLQIFMDYGLPTDEQAAYLHKYWFNPHWADPNSGCLWPDHQPIEPVFRQGLIKAIELATLPAEGNTPARILPLNTCWVCVGTAFQMGICATDRQVTCIILTPDLPEREWERFRDILTVRPMGSVAYKLAQVAQGLCDVTFSLVPKNEWDICAGTLLVTEAGGQVTDLQGQPFRFNQPETLRAGLIATNGHLHAQVLRLTQTPAA